jgi:hypothetical protein
MFVAFLGIGAIAMGLQERSLAQQSSTTPEEITLRQLIERGPEGNPYVVLSDFALGEDYVYEHRKGQAFLWERVWVPIFPADEAGAQDNPQKVQAIIKSSRVRNAFGLAQLAARKKLRGMVINRVESLSQRETELLQQRYPGTDFSRCLIIEEGREPAKAGDVRAYFVVGSCLLGVSGLGLLGILGLALAAARRRPMIEPRPHQDRIPLALSVDDDADLVEAARRWASGKGGRRLRDD